MRKVIWLALIAVPVILVLTAPARVVVSLVDAPDNLREVQGSLWRGSARWYQPEHGPLFVNWRWQPPRTLLWEATGVETAVSGQLHLATGPVRLEAIQGVVDIDRVDLAHWLAFTRPRGILELDLDYLVVDAGQPPRSSGLVYWDQARLEGAVHERLGRIQMKLSDEPEGQRADIETVDRAPILVRGSLELDGDGYEVDLWLRADRTRPDLTGQLAQLGELQPDGQVRIRQRGALGW